MDSGKLALFSGIFGSLIAVGGFAIVRDGKTLTQLEANLPRMQRALCKRGCGS